MSTAVDGLSTGVALVGPVGDPDGRRRLRPRLDAHEACPLSQYEATGHVVGVPMTTGTLELS